MIDIIDFNFFYLKSFKNIMWLLFSPELPPHNNVENVRPCLNQFKENARNIWVIYIIWLIKGMLSKTLI